MVASSQPLASEAGLSVLKAGGNCVDAAIATAAALAVTEPCSTGLGGDAFLLYYDAGSKKVYALNGSGRSSAAVTLEEVRADIGCGGEKPDEWPMQHGHTVTIPGAAQAWCDAIEKFGSMPLEEVLAPAIRLASEGFPVSQITAEFWKRGSSTLSGPGADDLLPAPSEGSIFQNKALASVLEGLASGGREAFYSGRVAEAIVEAVAEAGGRLSMEDLATHTSSWPEAITTTYRGFHVYECPPNGQGLAALLALRVADGFELGKFGPGSVDLLHHQIEAMRIAFADARRFITDPAASPSTSGPGACKDLLSEEYTQTRRALLSTSRATTDVRHGSPFASTDTVSFQVVDASGSAVSMVNSNYTGFGSGIVPRACGFSLQNRGANFSLDAAHPNCFAPGKRTYHTIIPGLALYPGPQSALFCSFTCMGGFMQPQGHLQLISAMLDLNMDPQSAIDLPRFCIADGQSGGAGFFEDGIDPDVVEQLRKMGHKVATNPILKGYGRMLFGRAQIILRDKDSGVLCAGSDGRADGAAMGW